VAVDLGQLLIVKNQLSAAIDAAALDIGANSGLSNSQASAQAQAFVNANFSTQNSATLTNLSVTQNTTASPPTVSITATATVNTSFVQIIGYNTLSTTVSTQVTLAQQYLEVALVLDNTGSMLQVYGGETGIQGLKDAATTLVNTLFASDPTGQYVKIAVVPFTDNVNAGTQYANSSWIDNSNSAGSMSQENINVPAGTGLISFASQLAAQTGNSSWAWGGCVRQRTEPYDVEDVAPSSSTPATLYTPYFAPDEPDCCVSANGNAGGNNSFYNSYLSDGPVQNTRGQQQESPYYLPSGQSTCTTSSKTQLYPYASTQTESEVQICYNKYTTNPQVQSGSGPNALCTVQPVIPLTNNQTDILNEISAMQAYGATVIPAGLEWGWHMLSPNFPISGAVPYSNTNTLKVIILLTDGYNDVQLSQLGVPPTATTNGFNRSVYSAYGYGSGPHLNLLPLPQSLQGVQDQADYNLDQKEIQLCNNIKAVTDANGNPGRILIYAIGFGTVINNSSLQLLQQCATNSSTYFYNPTSEELITTFQNIAVGLSKLRISR
jgi:Flp pilus assembly protein TadG